MSKMDALRAMREARYAEAQASKPKAAAGKPKMPAKAPVAPVAPAADTAVSTTAGADEGLCGHRSMNGRTCTREHGHAAKNHRYS